MNLEDNAKRLLLIILSEHSGHENRIKRRDLLDRLNHHLSFNEISIFERRVIGDRKMRDLLEEVRNEKRGAWVCAALEGGYFMAKDVDELDDYTQADLNRAYNLYNRVRTQRNHAKLTTEDLTTPQIRMPL